MYSHLIIYLKNTGEKKVTLGMSSVFHGALMELLGNETAAWLHQGQINPYAQYIQYDDNTVRWMISTMTQEAYQKVICPLLESTDSEIYLSYHDMHMEIIDKKVSCVKQEAFLKSQYFCDYDRYFTIRFLTPTSFKSKGKYMNYPTLRWIFQSLMNKNDALDAKHLIYDEEVLTSLEDNCYISAYKLHSVFFSLEGVKIFAFMGSITICVTGSQSIINLVNYLLMLGEYTGVGIKSSMGMGAITVEHKERK